MIPEYLQKSADLSENCASPAASPLEARANAIWCLGCHSCRIPLAIRKRLDFHDSTGVNRRSGGADRWPSVARGRPSLIAPPSARSRRRPP